LTKYKKPSLTVDIIIFNENKENQRFSNSSKMKNKNNSNGIYIDGINENNKNDFILIKRKNEPFKNHWAIPGGFVDHGETVENAAIREAKEETGVDVKLEKLFGVYSEPNRDPRDHTVTIVYLANGDFDEIKADSDAVDADIYSFNDIKSMKIAFDHNKILKDVFKEINKN